MQGKNSRTRELQSKDGTPGAPPARNTLHSSPRSAGIVIPLAAARANMKSSGRLPSRWRCSSAFGRALAMVGMSMLIAEHGNGDKRKERRMTAWKATMRLPPPADDVDLTPLLNDQANILLPSCFCSCASFFRLRVGRGTRGGGPRGAVFVSSATTNSISAEAPNISNFWDRKIKFQPAFRYIV